MRRALPWLLLAGACTTTVDPPAPTPAFCASDPRVQAFQLGVQSACVGGQCRVRIVEATPAPVVQGLNDWTVVLEDPSGKPIDGATLSVKPSMPDHGHGSPTLTQIAPLGGGRYKVTGINLAMRGVWLIPIVASGPVNDQAAFTFCVDGS
jgi:hypothetical protein